MKKISQKKSKKTGSKKIALQKKDKFRFFLQINYKGNGARKMKNEITVCRL